MVLTFETDSLFRSLYTSAIGGLFFIETSLYIIVFTLTSNISQFSARYPRFIGQKYMMSYMDEQVTVFDCIQRFRRYTYVAIIDVDEFIMPKVRQPNYKVMMVINYSTDKVISVYYELGYDKFSFIVNNV